MSNIPTIAYSTISKFLCQAFFSAVISHFSSTIIWYYFHSAIDMKLRRELISLTHQPKLARDVAFLYYGLQKGLDRLFEGFSHEHTEKESHNLNLH
jgi:hypothetical protein